MASKDFKDVQIVKVTFDTAAYDSAGVINTTAAAHPTGVFIPNDAIVTEIFYEVETTFETAGADAGTIAIMINGANDVVSTMSVADAGNIWDAGLHGTIVGQYALSGAGLTSEEIAALKATSFIKTTALREVTFTVATQALTAGKLHLYIIYTVGV